MNVKKYLTKIEDLSHKKIALTGATSGIGLALLKHLVSKNAYVALLVRNLTKAKEIVGSLNYSKIDIIEYDQSSYKSIEKAIDELLVKHSDIDTIVLNAGVLSKKGITEEGYSLTIGVNYFGVRHFIEYISPKLTKETKIVIQGSLTAGARLSKKTDITRTDYGIFKQYNTSKIYLEAYFNKLVKDNSYPLISYVLTEPGISSTRISRNLPKVVYALGKVFLPIVFSTSRKASLTLLTGISDKSKNGDFIVPRGIYTMSGFPKYKKFPPKREREYLFE